MTEMEVHIQQTNDRLLCIQQVVNEVSAQPGYDLDLGYRLLALCAAHSDKFTSKSAGVLSSWCEELGRLVLVRHQKTQSGSVDCPPPGPGGPTGAAAALQKPLGGLIDGGAGIQWQQQPQHQQPIPPVGLHDPMSVATPGWATGAGSSPAGTVAHLPGGQGLLPSAVLPGVGGYTSSQQRPLHTGGGPSAAAGMGPSGYHRGPPGAVMFPDGSAAVSAPSSGAKYGTYAGGGGVRQPGAVAGAVFNQHGMCPTGHDLVAGQMPVVSSVTPGQGPSQIEDQTQQQQICQPRSDGHVGGPAGAAITGNQGGHCQSQQMASMQSVYGMPYNPQQSPYTATNRLAAVSGGPMGPSGVQTAAHVMPPAAQQGSAVAAAGMSQLPVPGGNLVQGSVGLLPADDPMVVGASGGVPGGTLKSSGPVKGAVGVGGNGGAGAVFVGHQQQRPAPYPNPQQYMQSKRAQFVNGQVPPSEAMYSMGQQFTGQTYGPWAAGGGRPGTHLSPNYPVGQPRQNQAAAGGYCGSVVNVSGGQNGGNGYMIPAGSCRSGAYNTQLMAGQTGYPNPMYAGGQHMSPVLPANQSSSKMAAMAAAAASGNVPQQPYNCMPSLPPSYMNPGGVPPSYPTIAAGISPSYGSHTMSEDPKPVIMNGKIEGGMPPTAMRIKKEEVNDDLRLTFPVRDGVVLPPFRLEHNLSVSNHVFHLRESVYQTLIYRPDLELQLKCFHHEDRQMATNWPMSVSISVNSTLLSIDRSADGVASHRPLYLKSVCQPGRNTIQITSHLFFLTLVHRPSVKSVLQGLLRKRLLPAEHCVTKIKRSFVQPGVSSAVMGGGAGMSGECDEQTIKLSLKCPITYRTIALPARGHDCKHIQCFDLESYLQVNCERSIWRCPICNKSALLEGLEIDQYLWGILNNLSGTEFEEVTLDPSASWKPVPAKTIRDDDTSMKRWNKAISPSSMNLPTMTSWQDSSSFVRNQSSAASRPNQALQGPLPTQLQPQQQQPFFQGGASVNQYDRGQGPSPSFSPIGTPDFLSTLTHAGDNLLHGNVDVKGSGCPSQSDVPIRQPRTPVDGQMVTGSTHTRVPVDGQSIHPCTPLDGQLCGNPRTPLDGQMGHPRTPLDSSQLRTPVDGQLLHPRTPLDGHMLGHPITPIDGQTVNPRTPVDGSMLASCPRTPVDGHHFHATDSGCGSDVSSVRPMPGTPGSNPRTPASGGSRTYSAAVAVVAVSSASAAAATVNGSSSRSGSSTSCSSSVNSNSSTNNNNIINGCSNDASQQPNSRAPSAGDSASLLGVDFNFDATAFVDSEGHGHKTLDLLQEEIDDPTELLSYLGPSADNSGGAACSSNADDLLSLFT